MSIPIPSTTIAIHCLELPGYNWYSALVLSVAADVSSFSAKVHWVDGDEEVLTNPTWVPKDEEPTEEEFNTSLTQKPKPKPKKKAIERKPPKKRVKVEDDEFVPSDEEPSQKKAKTEKIKTEKVKVEKIKVEEVKVEEIEKVKVEKNNDYDAGQPVFLDVPTNAMSSERSKLVRTLGAVLDQRRGRCRLYGVHGRGSQCSAPRR